LSRVPGLGVVTIAQLDPFQWRASVTPLNVGVLRPTAHASVAENACTSVKLSLAPFGTVVLLQLVPLKRSATAPPPPATLALPTANAFEADVASTALSPAQLFGLPPIRSGLGNVAQTRAVEALDEPVAAAADRPAVGRRERVDAAEDAAAADSLARHDRPRGRRRPARPARPPGRTATAKALATTRCDCI
jgi:hypothetical protein